MLDDNELLILLQMHFFKLYWLGQRTKKEVRDVTWYLITLSVPVVIDITFIILCFSISEKKRSFDEGADNTGENADFLFMFAISPVDKTKT